MKNILITGGLGFIGFNAVKLWKKLKPDWNFYIVDKQTYAAMFMLEEKLYWLEENNIKTFKFDISDPIDVNYIKETIVYPYKIDTIVNFAAESHVDLSITGPEVFYKTNVMGTFYMLEIARMCNLRFHQIGTDEVYGETFPESDAYEDHTLKPSSPYSSSKCAADLMTLSYYRTYGTKVTVSRCTNNFGKYQDSVKLIPTVISKALKNEKIPVYGEGTQKRHWIYVDEHNKAVLDILENGEFGKIYNIAPTITNYLDNITIIKDILIHIGKSEDLIENVKDRPGHDTSYYLKSTKYLSKKDYLSDLYETIDWYKKVL